MQVSGVVTLDGKPVVDQPVNFKNLGLSTNSNIYTDAQGRYEVRHLNEVGLFPPGEYEVCVDPIDDGGNQPSNIPMKYRDGKTSGFKLVVGKERVVLNIEMKTE